MTEEVRCGTCKYFIFGYRSFCGWEPPVDWKLPAAYHLNSMWVDDGKNCKTWEPLPKKKTRKKKEDTNA